MATDIVPSLLEKIQADFNKAVKEDKWITKYMKHIRDGDATMHQTSLFARRLGEILADTLGANVTQDILPDGKMYYNIADRLIRPMLTQNFDLTNSAAEQVQALIDQADGIRIKPIKGEFPEERVDTLIDSLTENAEFEIIAKRMLEPVANISQSFFDDFVGANVDFRAKAGLQSVVIRKLAGGACPWCMNLAGTYNYPDDVPGDIFRRHDRCKCTVVFKTEKNGRAMQNVHSKRWYDAITQNAIKANDINLTTFTQEEARRLQESILNK